MNSYNYEHKKQYPLQTLFRNCLNATYFDFGDHGSVAATISHDGETLFIYFQWSKGRRDWINNFRFPKKAYKRMKHKWRCHGGYLRVWKSMQDQVIKLAYDAIMTEPTISNIICVGYSHGAPLAALAVENFKYLGLKLNISGVGFGGPRLVGGNVPDEVLMRFDNFVGVRNRNDIVSSLPPKLLGFKDVWNIVVLPQIDPNDNYGCFKAHYDDKYLVALAEHDLLFDVQGNISWAGYNTRGGSTDV